MDEELEQEQEEQEQQRDPFAAARANRSSKRNMQADRTTAALDNAAKIAQFTPAAGVAKGYQAFRSIDNKLTGGKISRGVSKVANASNPSLKRLGALGGSKLANNTIGLASKVKGGSGSSSSGSKGKTTEKTGATISGNKNANAANSKKDIDKKAKNGGRPSSISDKSDEKKEKTGLQSSSMEILIGEMTPMKIILLALGVFVGFVLYFFVVISVAIEDKKSFFKSQAFGYIAAGTVGYAHGISPTTIGNVTKKDDNSYKKSAYDFIDFKEEYEDPTDTDESDVRDNSGRDKSLQKVRQEYPDYISNGYYEIGTNFTGVECYGSECDNTSEVRFYQKVEDIAFRYKKLYNIELDWPLIMAAVMIKDIDKQTVFERNLTDYTVKEVSKLKKVMSLDWEYDYKNIEGYEYLSPDDARYDLQILAKNMVKKTTIQTCTNTKDGKIVKQVELEDIEDALIDKKLDNGYYLVCDKNTKYAIKSTYKLDKDKFDEFLDEYIEKRYYTQKGNSNNSSGPSDYDGGAGPSTFLGNADFGWPLPDGATKCRSSVFGPRIHPITGKYGNHSGDDYPAATGTPVYAIADGTVVGVVTGCVVGNMGCGGKAGNHVVIDHGNGIKSVYMHASSVSVTNGQHVTRGQEIMKVGSTGSSTGPHLHITIKENGTNVAPANYIGALPACS